MSEGVMDLRHEPRDRAYALLHSQMLGVLAGMDDDVTGMATLASLLHHSFGHLWTGFYRVVGPQLLRVGPYQGTVGCIEIAFGRGACGTAAAERRTVIVPDVCWTSTRSGARPSISPTRTVSSASFAGSPAKVAVDAPLDDV